MCLSSFIKIGVCQTVLLFFISLCIQAQPITGVWKGKMGTTRVELKLVRKGDSLIGTSYYYDSKTNYRRYSVKGYFDDRNNDVIWWDDVLIEDQHGHHSGGALLAVADFNCPGEGIMKLDGKSSGKDDDQKDKKELHLLKTEAAPLFPDEWDFLIENYAYGVNHPEMVDSIEQIAFNPTLPDPEKDVIAPPMGISHQPSAVDPQPSTVNRQPSTTIDPPPTMPPSAETNEERLISRTKILQNVIPVKGDSIELRFYDNAEIDGDSIAVFLNGRLLKEHILLAEEAYIMKIAVRDLQPDNELVMVAENLGTIPPNTSLMVAIVEDKRYEAHLQSTMGSSALVRLVKP
jgi:hypothetical protein